jgi:hypothetical protein
MEEILLLPGVVAPATMPPVSRDDSQKCFIWFQNVSRVVVMSHVEAIVPCENKFA